jgi:hypothetical protein
MFPPILIPAAEALISALATVALKKLMRDDKS